MSTIALPVLCTGELKMVRMNFIFIFISSSTPNLLRKKSVKQKIKKNDGLTVICDPVHDVRTINFAYINWSLHLEIFSEI